MAGLAYPVGVEARGDQAEAQGSGQQDGKIPAQPEDLPCLDRQAESFHGRQVAKLSGQSLDGQNVHECVRPLALCRDLKWNDHSAHAPAFHCRISSASPSGALFGVRSRKFRNRWKVMKLALWKELAPPSPSS